MQRDVGTNNSQWGSKCSTHRFSCILYLHLVLKRDRDKRNSPLTQEPKNILSKQVETRDMNVLYIITITDNCQSYGSFPRLIV